MERDWVTQTNTPVTGSRDLGGVKNGMDLLSEIIEKNMIYDPSNKPKFYSDRNELNRTVTEKIKYNRFTSAKQDQTFKSKDK